ncbi:hypothetical protein U9M48_009501 [Paspalum notatum var. saurae]|uniref:Uncharacterized protein n=1 Tax=Paspalum notatum var. saurae TaxID=547442 RepID=A0AAQ3SRA8_PASNO
MDISSAPGAKALVKTSCHLSSFCFPLACHHKNCSRSKASLTVPLLAYSYALYISTKNSSSHTRLQNLCVQEEQVPAPIEGAIQDMAKITAMAAAAVAIALLLLPIGRAEEKPTAAHPHGLPFESPLAMSPAAYDFFHPSARARRAHGVAPALAPRGQQQLRESAVRGASASVAKADQEEGAAAPVKTARHHVVAGVIVGAAAAALVAVGVAYAVVRRRVVAARGGVDLGAVAPKSNA